MQEEKGPNKAIIGIIVIVLIAAATTGVVAWNSQGGGEQIARGETKQTSAPSSHTPATTAANGHYKDGTYTAEGRYITPGGQEVIGVKVMLAGGVISDAEVTQKAVSSEAHQYQAAFASDYKAQVVGKKISDVSLSRVAGSSLTPNGFNSALETIKSQAQS